MLTATATATATAATSTNMRTTQIDNNSTQQQEKAEKDSIGTENEIKECLNTVSTNTINIDTDLSQEEMLREMVTTKSAEQIYEEIKEGLALLKNKIEEAQRTIDNTTGTTRQEAQEEMLELQELLRETDYSEEQH